MTTTTHPRPIAEIDAALPLVYAQASAPSGEPADVADALRYRWLTADHDDPAQRQCARDITERMAVMSYASVSASIDAAMTLGGEDADRATTAPAPQPAVRCELVESCRKCRHSVGRQSCALAGRDFDGAGIPAWCPLPVYGTAPLMANGPEAGTTASVAGLADRTLLEQYDREQLPEAGGQLRGPAHAGGALGAVAGSRGFAARGNCGCCRQDG